MFKNLNISTDGQNVAYTKDGDLYISTIDLTQGKEEVEKVSEKVISYGWVSSSDLAYSNEKGGLNGFNLESKKSSTYIESQDTYQGIVGDGKGTIYGEVYRYYTKDGKQYVEDKGVISYEVATGKEKVIVPSKPSNEDVKSIEDLGLMPTVAGISKDGAYVYIWCKVHSASTNSDGVAFGVYEVDVINGTFTNILPKDMISTEGVYGSTIAKGMVTMTPSFSPDGKKVIFSASNADENGQQWNKEPHNIYTVDLDIKKVEKITKDNTFDFAPAYISKGAGIVFVRRNNANNISLWKLRDNKEECITKDIKLDEDSWYYGHYKLENTLDIYISKTIVAL